MKSSLKQVHSVITVLALALAGLQSLPALAADRIPGDATGPRLVPQARTPETQVIRLRPGQIPYVTLTGDIFYRVLASEIAAQRGMYSTGASTLLNLSRETGDPRLARRARSVRCRRGNRRRRW